MASRLLRLPALLGDRFSRMRPGRFLRPLLEELAAGRFVWRDPERHPGATPAAPVSPAAQVLLPPRETEGILSGGAPSPAGSPEAPAPHPLIVFLDRWLPREPEPRRPGDTAAPANVERPRKRKDRTPELPAGMHEQEGPAAAAAPARLPEPREEAAPRPARPEPSATPAVDYDSAASSPGVELHPQFYFAPSLVGRGLEWLSDVSRRTRVHTDLAADRLARRLGADAVTLGHEIFFRAGRFDPSTPRGVSLLSHELTHVRQDEDRPAPLLTMDRESSVPTLEAQAGSVEHRVFHLLSALSPSAGPIDRSESRPDPELVHRTAAPTPVAASAAAALPLRAAEGHEPGEASASAGGPPADPAEIAQRVYRILECRLRIDRERFGLGRS